VLFTKYSKDTQILVDEADGVSWQILSNFWLKNVSGRDHGRDLGIDGRIIL
jgi:hypothetical protein